jgi:hypothetical protein
VLGSLENSAVYPDKSTSHFQALTGRPKGSTDNQHQIVEQHQNFGFS